LKAQEEKNIIGLFFSSRKFLQGAVGVQSEMYCTLNHNNMETPSLELSTGTNNFDGKLSHIDLPKHVVGMNNTGKEFVQVRFHIHLFHRTVLYKR
jgi:hypothetical protein